MMCEITDVFKDKFLDQVAAIELYCEKKLKSHPDNLVGPFTMGATGFGSVVQSLSKSKFPVELLNFVYAHLQAKIKWAIEGDENSKYYYGVINKKRNQLSIRGILVEGSWIDFPSLVKNLGKSSYCGVGRSRERDSIAFMADKQILDGPFILNETVQWCKKKKKQSLVFKVDFKKAYDSVRWDHLDKIMRRFGFEEKWVDIGLFKGIELAPSLNISHMFYADDAIFMGQWSESSIDIIVKVLDCFNRASGSMPVYHMSLFKVPKKVRTAVAQGETLMNALQDVVPENVRRKLTSSVTAILQNQKKNSNGVPSVSN
nr:RNA-directed DNA polymerase, eukaryota, reverse transcriptase zinc-binding domain protein [Tanacetum cinerariifolium]